MIHHHKKPTRCTTLQNLRICGTENCMSMLNSKFGELCSDIIKNGTSQNLLFNNINRWYTATTLIIFTNQNKVAQNLYVYVYAQLSIFYFLYTWCIKSVKRSGKGSLYGIKRLICIIHQCSYIYLWKLRILLEISFGLIISCIYASIVFRTNSFSFPWGLCDTSGILLRFENLRRRVWRIKYT